MGNGFVMASKLVEDLLNYMEEYGDIPVLISNFYDNAEHITKLESSSVFELYEEENDIDENNNSTSEKFVLLTNHVVDPEQYIEE